jgi:hypothetical protein
MSQLDYRVNLQSGFCRAVFAERFLQSGQVASVSGSTLCGAGCMRPLIGRGTTAVGYSPGTRTSLPTLGAYWISTPPVQGKSLKDAAHSHARRA